MFVAYLVFLGFVSILVVGIIGFGVYEFIVENRQYEKQLEDRQKALHIDHLIKINPSEKGGSSDSSQSRIHRFAHRE